MLFVIKPYHFVCYLYVLILIFINIYCTIIALVKIILSFCKFIVEVFTYYHPNPGYCQTPGA